MRRMIIITMTAFLSVAIMYGKEPVSDFKRITFGAEWGYVASIHCGLHHNFFSDIGYRVDMRSHEIAYISNGDVYVHLGCNVNHNWNLSLYTGIAGVYDLHKIVPVSIRATRYLNPSPKGDRWFLFLDGGSGLSLTSHPQATANGKLGAGYRISLSPATKLDFSISYRMTLTHPTVEYDGYIVDISRVNRNNGYVSGIALSMSLTL